MINDKHMVFKVPAKPLQHTTLYKGDEQNIIFYFEGKEFLKLTKDAAWIKGKKVNVANQGAPEEIFDALHSLITHRKISFTNALLDEIAYKDSEIKAMRQELSEMRALLAQKQERISDDEELKTTLLSSSREECAFLSNDAAYYDMRAFMEPLKV